MKPIIGKQIIDIITSGMYHDPLSVYREYIQNSADSIDTIKSSGNISKLGIDIHIDGLSRTIEIYDNGPGISNKLAPKLLLNVGDSKKTSNTSRGFRGIGRLGGLAYCEKLIFETRAKGDNEICMVTWDGDLIRHLIDSNYSSKASDIINEGTKVEYRNITPVDKKSFFRVRLENVKKFHNNILLSCKNVKKYLSCNAPVPYHPDEYSYSPLIEEHLSSIRNFKSYQIRLDREQIYKPYADQLTVNGNIIDRVKGIETFQYNDTNGAPLAYGWYAKTNLKSSFPQQATYRGVSIREGNIRIGNEYFLAEYFTENRFATWHIGEIHVVNGKLKTNARRDGFEQSPDYERFIEQSSLLARFLSKLCRLSSKMRSETIIISNKLRNLESILSKKIMAVDTLHFHQVMYEIGATLDDLGKKINGNNTHNGLSDWYDEISAQFNSSLENSPTLDHNLDGRTLWRKGHKDLIKELCIGICNEFDKSKTAVELVETITRPYRREPKS